MTGSAWHTAFDGGTTQHGSGGRTLAAGTGVPEAAGCPNKHLMPEAGLYPTQLTDVLAVLHLAGGDPQGAEFCDGPGPGMALEQNSFLPPTTTGRGTWMTVIRRDHGELNITTNCITRSGHNVASKKCPTSLHNADSEGCS